MMDKTVPHKFSHSQMNVTEVTIAVTPGQSVDLFSFTVNLAAR